MCHVMCHVVCHVVCQSCAVSSRRSFCSNRFIGKCSLHWLVGPRQGLSDFWYNINTGTLPKLSWISWGCPKSWRACTSGSTGPVPSCPSAGYGWGRCWGGPTGNTGCGWVLAELVNPGLCWDHYPQARAIAPLSYIHTIRWFTHTYGEE